jgi:hypothetical protein
VTEAEFIAQLRPNHMKPYCLILDGEVLSESRTWLYALQCFERYQRKLHFGDRDGNQLVLTRGDEILRIWTNQNECRRDLDALSERFAREWKAREERREHEREEQPELLIPPE